MRAGASRGVGIRLFLGFAFLFVLTVHGRPFSDDVFQYEQVGVFVETGDFVMSPARKPDALGGAGAFMRPGVDGRVYLTLAPGLALASTPLGWLGARLGVPDPPPEHLPKYPPPPGVTFWASLTVPLAMAGTLWLVFGLVVHRSGSIRRGIEAAVVIGLATTMWFYATTFWSQPLATTWLVAAFVLLVRFPVDGPAALAAGSCLGCVIATRFELAVVAPWLFGLVVAGREGRAARSLMFLMLLAVMGATLMLWNEHRFGDPFETRSLHQGPGNFHPRFWPESLPGLLAGLVLYSPAVLLGVASLPSGWRTDRRTIVCLLGIVITLLFLYGSFVGWSTPAPMSWGSRFLAPVVPLLVVLPFLSPGCEPLRPTWARVLVALSAVVALVGVLQRGRLGTPLWWADDVHRAMAASVIAIALIPIVLHLRRAYHSAT